MDRRSKEVVNIVKNLQDECDITMELLNKLLAKSVSQANNFQQLKEMDSKLCTGRFLAFTQFQNSVIQKLLEFDIALEELIDHSNLLLPPLEKNSTPETPEVQTELLQNTKQDLIQNYLNSIEDKLEKTAEEPVNDFSDSISSSEYFNCTDDEARTDKSLRPSVEVDSQKSTTSVAGEALTVVNYEDVKQLTIDNLHSVKVGDLCFINSITSPSAFYIQIIDENKALFDGLSDLLSELTTDRRFKSKADAIQALGRYCCIKIVDYWYRAEVIDWLMDEQDLVMVQLIDFGGIYEYSYEHLRVLCKESYKLPKMAQLCHLEGIRPPYSDKNAIDEEWPQKSIDAFFNICGHSSETVYRIDFVSPIIEGDSYGIRLAINDPVLKQLDIGQILLNKNLAVDVNEQIYTNRYICDQIQTSQGLQGINAETSTDDILENFFERNKTIEAGNVNEAVMDYDPRDEAVTCKNLRPDGTCYKGSTCKFRHIPLKGGFTMDKLPVYNKAFAELKLPEVNDEVSIKICHIIDTQRFYAQIRPKSDNVQNVLSLSRLLKTMNNADISKGYKKLQYPPAVSQLVIVKHWSESWFRGRVLSIQIPQNGNGEATVYVYIVDYGDVIHAAMSDLREMVKDFLYLPFQAVECRMHNIKPKRDVDESEARRYLESLCLSDRFKAKVVAVQNSLHVLLYTREGVDVGEMVVEAGFAEFNTEHDIANNDGLFLVE